MITTPRGLRIIARRIRPYQRQVLAGLLVLFCLDTLFLLQSRPTTPRPPIRTHAETLATANTTVFIASVHRNTEDILAGTWNDAVVHLISTLGAENVYFSAVESGSQDATKRALRQLRSRLDAMNAPNNITLGMTLWEQMDELASRPDPEKARQQGWIWNARDRRYEMRRIPYLSRVRNQAMEPLKALRAQGRHFDRILWINDVVFDVGSPGFCTTVPPKSPISSELSAGDSTRTNSEQTEDVLSLLNTRGGRYAAACSMDFKTYPYYYDTFALRDDRGQKAASQYWPWFLSSAAKTSVRRGEPVKVSSCWNGMVSFDSAPFYANPPLEFRGIDDSLADFHLEASECCLIHADNALSSRPDKGVWLNQNVRVGYSPQVYSRVKGGRFPGAWATVAGAWYNRFALIKVAVQYKLEGWTVRSRLDTWRSETPAREPSRVEVGEFCIISESQVMWENGWAHL